MPAYNFQPQFVQPILDKTKIHTIRRRRKNPTEAGDWIYMYTGLRTKQAKKFAESIVVAVTPIIMYPNVGHIYVPARVGIRQLSVREIKKLIHKDGFEESYEFFNFFLDIYQETRLELDLIEWDVDRLARC